MNLLRKSILTAVTTTCLAFWTGHDAGKILAEELDLKIGLTSGLMSYEETGSRLPVASEWDGVFIGPSATAVLRYNPSYEIHLNGAFWASGNDTESWTHQGVFVQENDLEAVGSEWSVALVRNFALEKDSNFALRFGPSIGFEKFTRDNFVFYRDNSVSNTDPTQIDESVFYASVDAGINARSRVSEKNTVEFDVALGYILIDQVDNDAIPETIEGSGGYRLKSSILLHHKVKPNQSVGAGFVLSGRTLDGKATSQFFRGEPTSVEWPKNELINIGLHIFWNASF